jgi:hypothetical protein
MPFRRKIRRRIFWAALALGVSGLGFLAVLRAPAVQTRIVRWAATQGEGWRLDVARVSMGLAGGEARGLIFTMPGVVARAEPGVELRLRPGRFLFGGQELHVERASASGIRIVVTPSEIEPSKAPFLGVLELLRSPLPWVIGEARLDAEIELRDAGADVAKARLRLKGGGLTAARAGEFDYEIEAASRFLPPSADAVLRSKGVLRVRQDRAHGVEEMELSGDLRTPAYGPLRVPPGKFVLRVERTAAGERYSGRVGFGEGQEATAEFAAEFDRKGRRLVGSASGELDARLAAWAGLATEGWPEDKARWSADYVVGVDDGRVSARLAAGRAREPELVVAETKTGADVTVELRGLPLAWLGRWTEARGLAWEPGSRADGAWRITRAGEAGARVETLRPLVVAGLRARRAGAGLAGGARRGGFFGGGVGGARGAGHARPAPCVRGGGGRRGAAGGARAVEPRARRRSGGSAARGVAGAGGGGAGLELDLGSGHRAGRAGASALGGGRGVGATGGARAAAGRDGALVGGERDRGGRDLGGGSGGFAGRGRGGRTGVARGGAVAF